MKGKKFSAILCFVLALMYAQCVFADSGDITITTASLPPAGAGQNYSQTLGADGSPTSWAISSGDLPAGLTLSDAGIISGTVSTDDIIPQLPRVTSSSLRPPMSQGTRRQKHSRLTFTSRSQSQQLRSLTLKSEFHMTQNLRLQGLTRQNGE